jgi:hypothetical protein
MPTTTVQTATVLKASAGIVRAINVCVGGSATGTICDAASTSTAASSNAVAGLPTVAGDSSPPLPIVCSTGITVVPGTGQTVSVNWE